MKEKTKDNYDFSDFLLDDEFVRKVKDESGSDDYIAELKMHFPGQEKNIDMALRILEAIEDEHVHSTKGQRQKIWSGIINSFINSKSKRIRTDYDQSKVKSRLTGVFLRVAAGFILLVGIGALAFYYSNNKNDKELSIDRFVSSNKVDYKESQLILSDGKKIEVASGDANICYSADGAKVTINDTSGVVQSVKDEQFNQIIVPYGKYVSLQLSDGTKVWLNSGSRMTYPPVFNGNHREVYLQGEGYFEVTKNTQKPFFVKTDLLKVEVLGTKFDVQAYKQENSYSALLLEGKVSLSSRQKLSTNQEDIVLKQYERGEFSVTTNKIVVENVQHPENYVAWTYGYISFDEETLESLLKRISRYYNIDIQLISENRSFKISGKLDLKEDSERVLRGIAVISKMKLFKQEGGYIIKD